jgi:hypothetical protein
MYGVVDSDTSQVPGNSIPGHSGLNSWAMKSENCFSIYIEKSIA